MFALIFARLAMAVGFYVLAGGKLPTFKKVKGI